MKTLSIDIETYSDQPLAKTGVYRYVESPVFEILLFSYSVDGGAVQIVDLACGGTIPLEILSALTDETVTKWAFNANFERICLSRYLGLPTGEYLPPDSWKCSMIWAATMGLPLSLEGVGAVLGLEKQKLTEGKELIKYFCQPCAPTKSNGQRTRNRPAHAPEKWLAFKKYNIRDVETEMSIQARLAKFSVPDSVWDEYHLDQVINDRGVRNGSECKAGQCQRERHGQRKIRFPLLSPAAGLHRCGIQDRTQNPAPQPDGQFRFQGRSAHGGGSMQVISKEALQALRAAFPKGTRVELVKMDDPQAPPIGTKGTVFGVDDVGSIMVSWDNGCGLNVAYGEDICRKVDSEHD